MFVGSLTADLLLGDVHSLKGKRAVVRPIVAELRRRFVVSAAEVGDQDLHRRAQVAVATVAGDAGQVTDVLDACERLLAGRPEVTLLSTHRQLFSDTTTDPGRPRPVPDPCPPRRHPRRPDSRRSAMADPARARKLAVRIRQIVSETIEMQIKDPRLGMVTVTDARVTSDLREATVFYTVYGDETEIADSAKALASATGVLRSTVGKQTGIKFVPTLTFVADIVPDTARELEEALERARHADAELARAREGASYAGEADPYRKPAEDEDDDADDMDASATADEEVDVAVRSRSAS